MCGTYWCGPVELDVEAHEVRVNGVPVALTLAEFRILHYLLERPGRIVPRRDLLAAAGSREETAQRSVDAHVARLRGKLRSARAIIETIQRRGYRLAGNVATSRPLRDADDTCPQQRRRQR
jgi:DNA-binding response OmpR family regulator